MLRLRSLRHFQRSSTFVRPAVCRTFAFGTWSHARRSTSGGITRATFALSRRCERGAVDSAALHFLHGGQHGLTRRHEIGAKRTLFNLGSSRVTHTDSRTGEHTSLGASEILRFGSSVH